MSEPTTGGLGQTAVGLYRYWWAWTGNNLFTVPRWCPSPPVVGSDSRRWGWTVGGGVGPLAVGLDRWRWGWTVGGGVGPLAVGLDKSRSMGWRGGWVWGLWRCWGCSGVPAAVGHARTEWSPSAYRPLFWVHRPAGDGGCGRAGRAPGTGPGVRGSRWCWGRAGRHWGFAGCATTVLTDATAVGPACLVSDATAEGPADGVTEGTAKGPAGVVSMRQRQTPPAS
jgi:hypothetical protein